jgi:rSAM/selenodomain-associated transferase 1
VSRAARPAAVVLFARAAREGRVKTRLEPALGRTGALRLHRALVADSRDLLRAAARRCGARPFVAWTGRPPRAGALTQGRGDLGARLRRVVRRLLRTGHPAVVVIGSDSPTLPPAIIARAVRRLARGADLVLGPAADGGYYLIGLRSDQPSLFTRMPWGGARLCARTLRRAARLGLVTERLPPFWDVDRPADLARLRRALRGRRGRRAPRTAALLRAARSQPI